MLRRFLLSKLKNLCAVLNVDFILLSGLVLFGNRHIFDPAIWPDNDTLFSFQIFYGFYNDFFFHHELVRWLPFAAYGIQADFWQLSFLTPSMYGTALAGKLTGATNVLMLFKISVLVEHWMLLTGTYLLSRLLFRFRGTVFFVCLGILSSTLWLFQINWNFRIFYLLPLTFYFLIRFAREKKGYCLWLAGIVFVAQQIGVPPYFVTLHFLIVMILLAALVIRAPSAPASLLKISFWNVLCFGGFVVAAATYFYFAFHVLDDIRTDEIGRAADSYLVSLRNFLTYSPGMPLINFQKFLGLFYGGYKNLAATIYIGILPVLFVIYSVFRVRRPVFFFFLGITFFLAVFSVGDPYVFARVLYFLYPPIRLFRHIGMLSGLLRLFLLIIAGFGLDHFLSCRRPRDRKIECREKGILWDISALIFVLMGILAVSTPNGQLFDWLPSDFYFYAQFLALIAVSAFAWRKLRPSNATVLILLFFALDILSYQHLHYVRWPLHLSKINPAAQNIFNYSFQKWRILPPDFRNTNPRAPQAYPVILSTPHQRHGEMSTFLLTDLCYPIPNNHYLNRNVDNLINRRFSSYYTLLQRYAGLTRKLDQSETSDYQIFKKTVGCYQPKIQLLTNVSLAHDQSKAENIISTTTAIDQKVVIESAAGNPDRAQSHSAQPEKSGQLFVTDFSFNRLSLGVNVLAPEGAWLYYLDAWHPGWGAWVDGKETPIARANLAFKAVRLDRGDHSVRFVYSDGLQGIRAHLIALFGILFAIAVIGTALAVLIKRGPGEYSI
jgi:hypothetical protein